MPLVTGLFRRYVHLDRTDIYAQVDVLVVRGHLGNLRGRDVVMGISVS